MPSQPPETLRSEYSPYKRTRINLLYDSGIKLKAIRAVEDVPQGSIYGIVSRYSDQKSARLRRRLGRPRSLIDRDIRYILLLIEKDPFITTT